MKQALLGLLVSPCCCAGLALEAYAGDAAELSEGLLTCEACSASYPVIGGIPRLLPLHMHQLLRTRYPAFFASFGGGRQSSYLSWGTIPQEAVAGDQTKTVERFGFEWTEFSQYDSDNFLTLISPLDPTWFESKIGLDLGCGAGRHAQQAARYGAEVIAVDISWSIEAAYARNRGNPKVHIIQADLFTLPFNDHTFDFVYSLGVLHHTPDPPAAFSRAVRVVRPGGVVVVWVYTNKRRFLILTLSCLRRITTRLPNRALKWLARAFALVDYYCLVQPYRLLARNGHLQQILQPVVPWRIQEYAKHSFGVSNADWFDRLSYPYVHYYSDQEIEVWYRRNGLENIRVTPTGPNASTGYGVVTG